MLNRRKVSGGKQRTAGLKPINQKSSARPSSGPVDETRTQQVIV